MIALSRMSQLRPLRSKGLMLTGLGGARLVSVPLCAAVTHWAPLGIRHPPHVLPPWGTRRCIHIPPVLLPPVFFGGLLVALWFWKCAMLVVFQNKIIYKPGFPPTARTERISDWASLCGDIQWDRGEGGGSGRDGACASCYYCPPAAGERLRDCKAREASRCASLRSLLSGSAVARTPSSKWRELTLSLGNASSIPPRLPDLSWVLHAVSRSTASHLTLMQLTFVCLSYRGYWTSRGRPTESGLQLDAEAGVQWIAARHEHMFGKSSSTAPILLVWGQSIGSGVATNLAATGRLAPGMPIYGLLLETPFVSIRAMLEALYPQKWLPYRYLWPFLRNHLDSWKNLGLMAEASNGGGRKAPSVYILEAERDELVPKEQSERLYQRCVDLGLSVEKGVVPVAYHQEAIARGDGKKLAAQAILKLTRRALDSG